MDGPYWWESHRFTLTITNGATLPATTFDVVFNFPAGTTVRYSAVDYPCTGGVCTIPVTPTTGVNNLTFSVTFAAATSSSYTASLYDSGWTPDRLWAAYTQTGLTAYANYTVTGTFSLQGRVSRAGIPVMAHIGLQPQSVEKEGGYRIKGRTREDVERLLADAEAVEKAGAFSVVIEGTMEPVAAEITRRLSIPTIGIGASAACDGQVLVIDDAVGLTVDRVPKFVKEYADLRGAVADAARRYAADVRARRFPGPEHVFQPKGEIAS